MQRNQPLNKMPHAFNNPRPDKTATTQRTRNERRIECKKRAQNTQRRNSAERMGLVCFGRGNCRRWLRPPLFALAAARRLVTKCVELRRLLKFLVSSSTGKFEISRRSNFWPFLDTQMSDPRRLVLFLRFSFAVADWNFPPTYPAKDFSQR